MKKTLLIVLIIAVLIASIFVLTGCEEKKEENKTSNTAVDNKTTEESFDWTSLSAEDKVKHAVHEKLKEVYGDKYESAKIVVDKTYTQDEISQHETLRNLNISSEDIAFEVSIDIEPKEGVDKNIFMVPDGRINDANGWITDIHRLGILKYNAEKKSYTIENYGTGW